MIIRSLRQHFPARFPEWMNSDLLVLWGGYILIYPEIFTQHETSHLFAGMAAMVEPYGPPSIIWGWWAVSVGLLRWLALFINGAYFRTPLIRLIGAFLSAFIWTQVLIGLKATGIATPTICVYAVLVGVDIYSAFRAAHDVTFAELARRDSLELGRNVGVNQSL